MYWVPPEARTTLPSGWPIRSSWATEPRWVWNAWPALSTSRCLRPFSSVNWTWSPGRNGPRRWLITRHRLACSATGSDAGEGDVEVGGGEHAEHLTAGLDQQVFAGRSLL